MACGKMIITDRLPDHSHIDDLFIENEDIIYYDNIADCISKINYYLCKEGSGHRERIAANGYAKVLQDHTQVQRVESILKKHNQWIGNSQ
jgi:spore maturation protein CgeB